MCEKAGAAPFAGVGAKLAVGVTNGRHNPSPQPSPCKLALASLHLALPHPQADAGGEGVRSQRLSGRPLSQGERDRVRGESSWFNTPPSRAATE